LRLLLDTHVLLWWVAGREMSPAASQAIRSDADEVFVSAASVWEAEIKAALGRLRLDVDLQREPAERGFRSLDITAAHGVAAARLPNHHGDAFDRILIAQAQLEGLTIVTRDPAFTRYQVALLGA
jgi:PIN domain nuclease of toxin-antitoxin system